MSNWKRILLLVIFPILGCAMPINRHNAQTYAESGWHAAQSGDWKLARRQWGRAVYNADLGFMDKRQMVCIVQKTKKSNSTITR